MKKELVVSKSNSLARATNALTLVEGRVIEYCLSQIYFKEEVTPDRLFTVDVDAMADKFNMQRGQAYQELRKVFIGIRGKEIRFPKHTNDGTEVVTSWVTAVHYNDKLERLELRFATDIIPYISGELITKNFTTYHLSEIAKFKSSYTLRIYNICKSYAHNKASFTYETTVPELRNFLGIPDEEYPAWGSLNVVIKKCIAEINKVTQLNIELIEKKLARKVHFLYFRMAHKGASNET